MCAYEYYAETSAFILKNYEGQVEIICGDSRETLPRLIEQEPPKYDFIHIDGGHEGDVPMQDIINSVSLSHDDTFILVDDCNEVQQTGDDGWTGQDVNRAWALAVEEELIRPVSFGACNIGNCLGKPAKRTQVSAAPTTRIGSQHGSGPGQRQLESLLQLRSDRIPWSTADDMGICRPPLEGGLGGAGRRAPE